MEINYYRISDVDPNTIDDVDLTDPDTSIFTLSPEVTEHVYSYTCLRPHSDGVLYVGTTNMNGHILFAFDTEKKTFRDLGYKEIGTPYDIKIHRSLEHDSKKEVFYGVSAGLHLEKDYFNAPGSSIFRYVIESGKIEPMSIPLPHEYTQTIKFDPVRRLLYGFTLHTFSFYVYDVDKAETVFHALSGSISHISAIDDDGCIWSTWGRNTHYIYKYDPEKNAIEWTTKKFPEGGSSYMYPGAGPIDCMLNGGDGYLYVALETGSLIRLDPGTVECEYLGRPSPHPRMPALVMGEDGLFYGTCGDRWNTHIFTFDRKTRGFEIICTLAKGDVRCFRPHDIAVMKDRIYVGETDNPKGLGALWEVML